MNEVAKVHHYMGLLGCIGSMDVTHHVREELVRPLCGGIIALVVTVILRLVSTLFVPTIDVFHIYRKLSMEQLMIILP